MKTTTIDQSNLSTTARTLGFRLNWGAPIHGWGVESQRLINQYVQINNKVIVDTALSSTIFNLRRQYAIYSGEMGHLAVGGSIGYAYSRYVMHAYSDNSTVNRYARREIQTGLLGVAVIFGYEINPEWVTSVEGGYQIAFSQRVKDPSGAILANDLFSFSGVFIRVGSIFRL